CSNKMESKVSNDPVVAIVGVTGAVGAEFIATMDKRGFAVGKLKALASARSAGKTVEFRGKPVVIEELTERSFEGVDIALFAAGDAAPLRVQPVQPQHRHRSGDRLQRRGNQGHQGDPQDL